MGPGSRFPTGKHFMLAGASATIEAIGTCCYSLRSMLHPGFLGVPSYLPAPGPHPGHTGHLGVWSA